jgi:hypothetical protein
MGGGGGGVGSLLYLITRAGEAVLDLDRKGKGTGGVRHVHVTTETNESRKKRLRAHSSKQKQQTEEKQQGRRKTTAAYVLHFCFPFRPVTRNKHAAHCRFINTHTDVTASRSILRSIIKPTTRTLARAHSAARRTATPPLPPPPTAGGTTASPHSRSKACRCSRIRAATAAAVA